VSARHTPNSEGLTAFQIEVAHAFFDLPSSAGFLLAGGGALLAQRLTTRPTQDLDFFTSPSRGDVAVAVAGFAAEADRRGWNIEIVRQNSTFARLIITATEQLLIDLAVDSPPERPPTASFVGPTYAPEELAGRKVIALFDRAEARDFADCYVLASRFGKAELLERAADIDPGFERQIFAQMLRTLRRFTDNEIPAENPDAIREFFSTWANELS
jgi:hypothetical protein